MPRESMRKVHDSGACSWMLLHSNIGGVDVNLCEREFIRSWPLKLGVNYN